MALHLNCLLGQLATILDSKPNKAIRQFVPSYDLNESLLHLPNALSANKDAAELLISEKASLVFEAEPEIVQLGQDLQEIELLDMRGFPYFLSLFGHHSSLATVGIMTHIAFAVGKPPMSKIMDVFGWAEGFLVAIMIYLIGAILTASSKGVIQHGIGQTAAALGSQGLQLSHMIIVANTSSLTSWALLTWTITLPWIFTTWIGPVVGSWFLSKGAFGYRTIYLVFGLAVLLCASWLMLVLWMEWRKLKSEARPPARRIALPTSDLDQEDQPGGLWSPPNSPNTILYNSRSSSTSLCWFTVTRCLFFIVGVIVLVCFGIYKNKFAKFPVIPPRLVEHCTVLLGLAVCFWHFIYQFMYESYFTRFLQVARFLSAGDAQYVELSYLFMSCVSAIICGLLVKWTRQYKIWLVFGILLHAVGTLLMVRSCKLDNPMIEIVISQVIGGFGGGFTTLASQLGVQAVVAHQDVGISTAVFLTITQIGGAVGLSLAGLIWTLRLETALSKRLPASEQGNIPKIVSDLRFALTCQGNKHTKLNKAYVNVQRILNWLGDVIKQWANKAQESLNAKGSGGGIGFIPASASSYLSSFGGGGSQTQSGYQAVASSSYITQYHALGLLYAIRQQDQMAVSKLIQQVGRGNSNTLRSPFALCMLIRFASKIMDKDPNLHKQMHEFLEGFLRHKSDMVNYKAAQAFCEMQNMT
ncbi:hypothetical protein PtA15_6A595 [Puccinia triticina]|uniref:Clathrin/coatomer adaptor adaptin-like N-terminal domain-containing protein n=1 Tax=Puccinia triticina TaxID=208348 RepID=A0ABY7CMM9_9BASI|nr:uncharacterized protein PtA15_6A595 [Puccinia triticina]WAQ85965.1 hypothetical protein PtA15_6A595 [Puccinia triticina]